MPPLGSQLRRMDDAMRMWKGSEDFSTILRMSDQELSCFFTKGLASGPTSVVEDQHTRENGCIALGDPYCEWEFRR